MKHKGMFGKVVPIVAATSSVLPVAVQGTLSVGLGNQIQTTTSQDLPLVVTASLFCAVGLYWLIKNEITVRKNRSN